MNEINVRLDLTSPDGVKALRALADAFAPHPEVRINADGPQIANPTIGETVAAEPAPAAPTPTAAPVADAGSVPVESPDAPATGAAEKPRRRRLKAEKEEDERNGKDAEYQRLAKEMPNASVDEIRAILYGPVADPSDTPTQAGPTTGTEVGDGEPDWNPEWGDPTPPAQPAPTPQGYAPSPGPTAPQAPPAAPDAWAPQW